MRIYIGIGATQAQVLPFRVLKQTLLEHNSEHELIIENINDTDEYKRIESDLENTYGTVFSLQRFLVPKIANSFQADICMHLDSDMLCHKSLEAFFGLVVSNPDKIILPEPNPEFNQPQQTAVFGCVPSQWVIDLFESNLSDFLKQKISYVDLMRMSFSDEYLVPCSYIYNSREYYEQDTVILHLTDLYRQPWVNRFNSLQGIWLTEAEKVVKLFPELKEVIIEGIKRRYYLPSMSRLIEPSSNNAILRDLLFLPPQFDAYAHKRFKNYYERKFIGKGLKFVVVIWVQIMAIWHNLTNHRAI